MSCKEWGFYEGAVDVKIRTKASWLVLHRPKERDCVWSGPLTQTDETYVCQDSSVDRGTGSMRHTEDWYQSPQYSNSKKKGFCPLKTTFGVLECEVDLFVLLSSLCRQFFRWVLLIRKYSMSVTPVVSLYSLHLRFWFCPTPVLQLSEKSVMYKP